MDSGDGSKFYVGLRVVYLSSDDDGIERCNGKITQVNRNKNYVVEGIKIEFDKHYMKSGYRGKTPYIFVAREFKSIKIKVCFSPPHSNNLLITLFEFLI